MGKGLLGGTGAGRGIPKEGLLGSMTMPAVFAEAGMEHSRKYGTTFEQFAKVSVKNHHHSTLNPKAMYQVETPLEQVMGAEMISYPNTKLMCSVNVDGSAAAVLVSEKKAKQLGLKPLATIVDSVLVGSDPVLMLTGPIVATNRLFDTHGVNPSRLTISNNSFPGPDSSNLSPIWGAAQNVAASYPEMVGQADRSLAYRDHNPEPDRSSPQNR